MSLQQKIKKTSLNEEFASLPDTSQIANNTFDFTLLSEVPVPIIYVDTDIRYKFVNKAYAGWFGKDPLDIIQKTVPGFLGDEAYNRLQPHINKALNGQTTQVELEMPSQNGSRFIDATLTPDIKEGKVKGFLAIINNITEKKITEKELERKRFELEDYFDNASASLHWVDENGIIIWANKAELDMLGYTGEEYIGRPVSEFHNNEQSINHILSQLKSNKTLTDYEADLKCKDGSIRTVLINSNVLWEDGKFIHTRCFTTDITDRKKMFEALKESEENYRQIVQNLPVAAYTCDKEGNIILYNNAAVEIWGKKPGSDKKWIGWHQVNINGKYILPEESPMAMAVKTGKPVNVDEIKVEKPDGTVSTVLPHPRPLFNTAGEVVGGVNAIIDITNRKKTEQALKDSEQRYRSLINGLPAAIYSTDKEGIITMYNQAAVDLWGLKPETGKDKWCGSWKIFEPDGITEVPLDSCPMAITLKEKRKVEVKEPYIVERPDGSRRHFIPYPNPVFDSEGNLTGAVNMLIDVTERKIAEVEQAKLAAIVQSSDDAIISNNLEGIITSWNPAAERLYHYKADEIIGQAVSILLPKNIIKEQEEIFNRIKNGTPVEHYETKRVTKNGDLIDLAISVSPIKNLNGKVIGVSKIARDISAQKRLLEELRENEERLRMAIESTKLGTWEFHPITKELYCSNECKDILGVPPDMITDNEYAFEYTYADDRDLVKQEIKKALDPAGPGNCEIQYRIVRYDNNEVRWVKVQGKTFFNSNKQAETFIGTILDITNEKNEERQLIESVEMFQTMADNVPAMIWMSGSDKFNDYFNKAWLEFTGRTLQQEANEGWLESVHPEEVDICIETYNRCYTEQKGFYTEYRLRRHDGEYHWIADHSVPRFSHDGAFQGFISACIDIDDQKRFREKIQDSELLFKTISNASPAALWMTDTEGQNVFVNDTWIKWTGRSLEQQLTEGWVVSVLEEDRTAAVEKFMECHAQQKYYSTEFRFVRGDGEVRWGLTEAYPYYDINGKFSGYAGSVTDITELKKLEQRKDDFIKMASHELKTPITSISGYVQLLLNIYTELDDKKLQLSKATVKSSLTTISKQVSKLTRLISELLDLSKIESGKLELNKTEFDFGDLVEETVQDMRLTTSRHAIIYHHDFTGTVYADKDRISQAILNLLANAIKYSPDADNIQVVVKADKKMVTVMVQDYGIGIDKKDQLKIFDRFYRAEGKSEQTFPGFGIGLFIASEIIHRHHGNITVESEKGRGSLFTVSLPIESKEE